jgi:hypothetical protein
MIADWQLLGNYRYAILAGISQSEDIQCAKGAFKGFQAVSGHKGAFETTIPANALKHNSQTSV